MKASTIVIGTVLSIISILLFWASIIGGIAYLILHPTIIGEWLGAIKAAIN